MAEEVQDWTEVLGVTIYEERPTLILDMINDLKERRKINAGGGSQSVMYHMCPALIIWEYFDIAWLDAKKKESGNKE